MHAERDRQADRDRETGRAHLKKKKTGHLSKQKRNSFIRNNQKHTKAGRIMAVFRVRREFRLYMWQQHITTDVVKVTRKRCLRTDLLRTGRCRIIGERKEPCDHGMPVVLFFFSP